MLKPSYRANVMLKQYEKRGEDILGSLKASEREEPDPE